MKKLIAITAISLAALGGATAVHAAASPGVMAEIHQFDATIDVEALSDAQIGIILSVLHSGDSDGEKHAVIEALLK